MNKSPLEQLRSFSEQIATELVFAEPDKDGGLLPMNSLLQQLEEFLAANSAYSALVEPTHQARACVDRILESTGLFSALSLKWLREWQSWWQTALEAVEKELPIPTFAPVCGNPASSASEPSAPTVTQAPATASEPELVLNLEQDRELLGEFVNEAREHLQNIEQGVLVLEEHPTDADTLNAIFRAFHTVKGGSGFLNLTAIQSLAHELESLLDLTRQHKLVVTPPIINLILEGGDTLKRFVGEIETSLAGTRAEGPIVLPTLALRARVSAVLRGEQASPTVAAPSTPAPPSPEQTASQPKTPAAPSAPTAAEASAPTAPEPAAAAENRASAGATAGMAMSVKVDTRKLDGLVDLVGEMVIAQSLVVQNPDLSLCKSEQLERDLARLGRITKDLQRTAMSLRMVPIRTTFQKMQRLIRDVSAKLGKRVQLVTDGEETELDRTIAEEISDPLIHMVRNSLDHGIEAPDLRQQKGKPPQGTITLRAFHQGGNIVIELKDDGRGLDRERILAKAIEKGMAQADQSLSDSEVFNFIMAPGFSTAEKVTDVSGRGVGMDVVRRNVEKLHGKIDIQTTPGQGATFAIYLPLTLAIIDGLLVGVGEQRFILPTLLVREAFRPTAGMISTVQGRGEVVNVRGRLRPMLRLYSHLGIEPSSTDPTQCILLIVEAGNEARCVLVDRLLGKQEVVIKSLGETFRQTRLVAGAAILGDGRVGLILDPQALVHPETSCLEQAA
jgi:two-component system chemotaxis sensor kinase CheA